MQIYSDYLLHGLRARFPGVAIQEVVPSAPKWIGGNYQVMRLLRYGIYPLQAYRKDSAINHITEAGYAHLIRVLDPGKTIVTVHDVMPLMSWRGLIPGLSYPHAPLLLELSLSYLKHTAAVITPSECVRQDVIQYCGSSADKVHVVHHGIDKHFRPYSPEQRLAQRKKLGLPLQDYLILISGAQAYKNHHTCSEVLRRVRKVLRHDARLVRVGHPSTGANGTGSPSPESDSIIDLGLFPPDEMPAVYNAVDCLLFPSWYEGFGWPPLEAMACGVPVVASNAGSIPEIVGDAGHLCAPDDVTTLAERTCEVLEDTHSRSRLIEKGLERADQFTWDRHVERLQAIYAGVISTQRASYFSPIQATSVDKNGRTL